MPCNAIEYIFLFIPSTDIQQPYLTEPKVWGTQFSYDSSFFQDFKFLYYWYLKFPVP